ncbi:DUF1223 domain-containing protein [Nisaea acidiphila]|uniref:DUF1223 domain-containing protein n=1 Tax=Nisaea acidiphila TaxID=1862145 RepID=A0A9J7AW76_9PROT|nr:DUF1223 domain-containing protein [Nisaea acidiphila]UUX49685.1 DUF1223 domain-containing protein [Nisaea acidiphila]
MKTSRRKLLGGLAVLGSTGALGLAGLVPFARPVGAQGRASGPIVLELFTSQGCSSCPPADRLLGELAKEPDVLALAYHVDYWNYIGWEDPFSSKEMSDRQRRYGHAMRLSSIYTPQLVIDGEIDVVGSRRSRVLDAIEERRNARPGPGVTVGLERNGADFTLTLAPVGEGDMSGAQLLLVGSDTRHVTEVPRGENRGRTLEDFAVVRFYTALGTWDGKAVQYRVPASAVAVESDRLAVLVQAKGHGRIFGAGVLELKSV